MAAGLRASKFPAITSERTSVVKRYTSISRKTEAGWQNVDLRKDPSIRLLPLIFPFHLELSTRDLET